MTSVAGMVQHIIAKNVGEIIKNAKNVKKNFKTQKTPITSIWFKIIHLNFNPTNNNVELM